MYIYSCDLLVVLIVLLVFYFSIKIITCFLSIFVGFSHQGFQCKKCGAICHRICKALEYFSNCPGVFCATKEFNPEKPGAGCETNEIPTSLVPYVSEYFGVKLEEQVKLLFYNLYHGYIYYQDV